MDSCPNCGYCKHCGRSNQAYGHGLQPWYGTITRWNQLGLDPNSAYAASQAQIGTQHQVQSQSWLGDPTLYRNTQ